MVGVGMAPSGVRTKQSVVKRVFVGLYIFKRGSHFFHQVNIYFNEACFLYDP